MKHKEFDAVKMMRELRDQLSQKYASMSLQEEITDLQKHFPHILWKKRKKADQREAGEAMLLT